MTLRGVVARALPAAVILMLAAAAAAAASSTATAMATTASKRERKRMARGKDVHNIPGMGSQDGTMFYFSIAMTVGTALRILVKFLRLSIPYPFVLLVLGIAFGILASAIPSISNFVDVVHTPPNTFMTLFVPVIVFKTALCIDSHLFVKTWLQIALISVPGVWISSAIVGAIACMVQDSWSYDLGIFLGAICMPVYPMDVVFNNFYDIERNSKHIGVLLEGESMLSTSTVVIIYRIIRRVADGSIKEWYYIILMYLRFSVGGLILGFVLGKLCCYIIRRLYNDSLNVLITTLIFTYMGFFVAKSAVSVCGVMTVMIIGIMCSMERPSLSVELERHLLHFWEILMFITNNIIFLTTGIIIADFTRWNYSPGDIASMFIFTLVIISVRLLVFLILAPVLSRVGYGLNFAQLVVLVWSGIKGAITLCFALIIYNANYFNNSFEERRLFLIYCSGVVLLSNAINATTVPAMLRIFGLSSISLTRKVNMNNCMRQVLRMRERTIATLKMDKFLSDANWPLVATTTAMVHPYKISLSNDLDDEGNVYLGYKTTTCPDCQKDIVAEPTAREYREMTREARLRILKAKKISYARQYENGMLSKEALRILRQAVEVAMDTEELYIELDGLHKLFKKEGFVHWARRSLLTVFFRNRNDTLKEPRRHWRYVCYRIITNPSYQYFMYAVVVGNLIMVIFDYCLSQHTLLIEDITFLTLYLIEFLLKVFGYSWIYICRHGFRTYFTSYWDVMDFLVLLTVFADVILDVLHMWGTGFDKGEPTAANVSFAIRMVRAVRLLHLFHLLKTCYPRLLRYCDTKIDGNMAFAYDVGKGFVTGEEEVSEFLPTMVDNKMIREEMKARIEADRLAITKEVGMIQKDRPWIAITVKTKQAVRSTLNSMYDSINELKVSGWVDDIEYMKLMNSLQDRLRDIRSIKSVEPSPPNVIFEEVPWMAGDDETTAFLYEKVLTRLYEAGDIVCSDGLVAEGIFIVVTGIFKLNYYPRDEVLDKLRDFGVLPIFDYISSTKFEERFVDYIISGNCIGELCALTGRPYNCMVKAETHSQAYILSHEVLRQAMERSSDPINGLEARIWKSVCIRLAIDVLTEAPAYQKKTQEQMRYLLESAFVPNLSNYKVFAVNEMIADIVLLEGVVVDYNTRKVYVAPCYMPRTVQKLVLSRSSLMYTLTAVETKLLIIPEAGMDQYDIMEREEEISEIVSTSSLRCLRHLAKKRLAKRKKKRRNHSSRRIKYDGSKSSLSLRSSKSVKSVHMRTTMIGDEAALRTINTAKSRSSAVSRSSDVSRQNQQENLKMNPPPETTGLQEKVSSVVFIGVSEDREPPTNVDSNDTVTVVVEEDEDKKPRNS